MKNFILIIGIALLSLNLQAQNSCLEFDGTNDYVDCDNILTTSSPLAEFTIEFWMKLHSTQPYYMGVFGQQTTAYSSDNFSISFYCGDEANRFGMTGSWSDDVSGNRSSFDNRTTMPFGTGVWKHVATTFDGTTMKMFVDGVLIKESNNFSGDSYAGKTLGNTHDFLLGKTLGYGGGVTTHFFDGEIDEFRIWDDARTETEIRQNMYRELPDASGETNLVAYYKFDETSGTTLNDSKGSNDGALTNMSGNEWQTSPAMFGPKNALDFDGGLKTESPDYAYKNSHVTSNTDNFTMMAWIRPDVVTNGANGWRCIAYNGSDAGGYGIGIADSKVASLFGGVSWNSTNEVLVVDKWYHITMRRNNGLTEFFLNGKLLDYTTTSTPNTVSSKFSIGNMFQGDNTSIYTDSFDGEIDEVRVFDAALSDDHIRSYMCKTLTGNESNLVAYYNFDNSSGTQLQSFDGTTSNDLTTVNISNDDWVASSAFNIWLNTSDPDWSTVTNWSRGSMPIVESIGIYGYAGGSAPTFDNGDEACANTVVVSMDSDWLLGGGFYVSGNLYVESDIDLNGNNIGLGSSAYLIEDNGRIYGETGYVSTQRDLSNINENVAGLGAEISTSANMGTTTIKRYHFATSSPASIKRRYEISPSTNTGLNATLIFHYDDNELNNLTASYLELYRSTDNGVNWTDMNGSVNTFVNTITLSGIDAFSQWTAMESEDVTPPILDTDDPNHDFVPGNDAIIIAPNTSVTTDANLENATVSISPIVAEDILSVSSLPAGLSSTWDTDTKILSITGTGSAADYQTALRNVKFETTATSDGTRTIDFILGDGVGLVIEGEQHYYEVIYNGSSITWDNARSAALAERFGAAQGYLATVTSEAENDYLAEKVVADTWIGAADSETEDVWKWMDGPETGVQFWQGDASGSAVGGEYENWNANEPNNSYYSYGEDCAHMYGSNTGALAGYWNDYYSGNTDVKYYIVEYGGDGSTFTTIDDASISVKADFTWDGSEGTSWKTAGNWNVDAVPTEYCNLTITDVENDPVIGVSDAVDCNNLNINGGQLTIASDASGAGSLIVHGTSTGNVIFKRYVDDIVAKGNPKWHYVSSPVAGQALNPTWMTANTIAQTSGYNQFFRWDEPSSYWIIYGSEGNPAAFADETFVEARGYCITRDEAGELSFTGTVRTSNLNYPTTYTSDKGVGFNLVGNPFTSSIGITNSASSTEKFLTVNEDLLDDSYQALYIWDEGTGYVYGNNDYKIISNAAIPNYTSINQDYIQPGQAFMVKVVSGGGNLAFNEDMQAHSTDDFYKQDKEVWPSVELIVQNNELFNSTAIGFNENMTLGLDPSFDVGKMKGNPNIALYTRLVEDNGTDFAIQALPTESMENSVIPIGLDLTDNQQITFSIFRKGMEGRKIQLEDRLNGIFTDLQSDEYSTLSTGNGYGRFYLHIGNTTEIEDLANNNNVLIWQNGNQFTIQSQTRPQRITLTDITGRTLGVWENTENIPTPKTAGVYLVTVESENQRITKKIIIQ